MKIDAPRAYCVLMADGRPGGLCGDTRSAKHQDAIRIIRESDWRRIMAVLKAADNATDPDGNWLYPQATLIGDEVVALRKHLENHK